MISVNEVMFGGTPADVASFKRDVTVEDVMAARPLTVKLEAQRRVAEGALGSSVWL